MRRRQVLYLLGLGFPVALVHESMRGLAAQDANITTNSKTLQVNGVRLHYLEWGTERARPIVLLHPAPLNAHVWDQIGPSWRHSSSVIAPDARGFGDSAWSDSYDGDVFLDDLHALINALSLKQPILCGNSMGGTLAYMYAGLHPDLVERLITVDTGPGEPPAIANGAPPSRPPGPPPQPPGPFKSVEEAAAAIPSAMGTAFAKEMLNNNLKRAADGSWAGKH